MSAGGIKKLGSRRNLQLLNETTKKPNGSTNIPSQPSGLTTISCLRIMILQHHTLLSPTSENKKHKHFHRTAAFHVAQRKQATLRILKQSKNLFPLPFFCVSEKLL
ncbi:hypothetical protein GBA52_019035 [Prunus armeniaca]|nr:hypothetical protein GBA52_019035 [Prunus armeniaca]